MTKIKNSCLAGRQVNLKLKNLPSSPGVYFFYDLYDRIIYIGKAAVLKNRIRSYFVGPHDNKTEELISRIANIKCRVTDTVIEALILESNLIKKHQPKYNIREKDDKSFVQIVISNELFPRFATIRPTQKKEINFQIKKYFGPYTNSGAVKEILVVLRRLFTYRDCTAAKFNRYAKKNSPCLFYPLGLCPAPCIDYISKSNYAKIIKQIADFLSGKSKRAISKLKKQMKLFSRSQKYEQAAQIRNRIFAYEHINDVAVIKHDRSLEQIKNIPNRIECYDISNLPIGRQALGKYFAVGSMVVFTGGEIDKSEYRKFRINHEYTNNTNQDKEIHATCYMPHATCSGDPQMLASIVDRRFNHSEWPKPDLIILDGGKGQLSAVLNILQTKKIKLPVIAVAKGPPFAKATGGKPTRKGIHLFKNQYAENIILDKKFIERVRDEAHRFAISYHRKLQHKLITLDKK